MYRNDEKLLDLVVTLDHSMNRFERMRNFERDVERVFANLRCRRGALG